MGAQKAISPIEAALNLLAAQPGAGQVTSQGDARRLVVNPYPYTIFYRIAGAEIVIHGVPPRGAPLEVERITSGADAPVASPHAAASSP